MAAPEATTDSQDLLQALEFKHPLEDGLDLLGSSSVIDFPLEDCKQEVKDGKAVGLPGTPKRSYGSQVRWPQVWLKAEEPSCLDSLVAVPTSLRNIGCDALRTYWLQFIRADDLPSLEEIRDILAKQQLEFREIPKPAKNGAGKASPG